MKVKGVSFTTKFYVDKTPSPDFGYINLDNNSQIGCNKDDVIRKRDVLSAMEKVKRRQQAERNPDELINLNFRGI